MDFDNIESAMLDKFIELRPSMDALANDGSPQWLLARRLASLMFSIQAGKTPRIEWQARVDDAFSEFDFVNAALNRDSAGYQGFWMVIRGGDYSIITGPNCYFPGARTFAREAAVFGGVLIHVQVGWRGFSHLVDPLLENLGEFPIWNLPSKIACIVKGYDGITDAQFREYLACAFEALRQREENR